MEKSAIDSLIYVPSNEPTYLDIATDIVEELLASKSKVTVLLLANPSAFNDFYSSEILLKFNRINPIHHFCERMIKLGVEIVNEDIFAKSEFDSELLFKNETFLTSLDSSLITLFADSGPFTQKRHLKARRNLENVSLKVFGATLNCLARDANITRMLVPNGRHADQKASILAALSYGSRISVRYYEKGFTPGKYYLGEVSLHDRISMQDQIRNSYDPAYAPAAKKWFEDRQFQVSQNEFIFNWDKKSNHNEISSTQKTAVFFNSSADEFVSLGPSWNDSDWKSQWEAFGEVAEYLLSRKYNITFRLHPNGINKSRREKHRDKKALKHFSRTYPKIRIYEPKSKVDSYKLIGGSNLIVVWNSTVGLEAAFLGKPLIHLNASEWDLSIPTLAVRRKRDLSGFENRLPSPNSDLPISFVSGRMHMDKVVISNHFRIMFSGKEKQDYIYRLAKTCGGGKKINLTNFLKAIFRNSEGDIYQTLRKLNHKRRVFK